MSIIYYINNIGWNTVVELADLGLLTIYEEAVSLISDIRHLIRVGDILAAVSNVYKLEKALRLLIYILYKYQIEHKKQSPEEVIELIKVIQDKWLQLYKDFKTAVDNVIAKRLGIQQQFIGESYIALYINRLVDFTETVAFNIVDLDKLKKELQIVVASMPKEGSPAPEELMQLEELASEEQTQQTQSELLSDEELKLIRYIVTHGGKVKVSDLAKKLKKNEEEVIRMVLDINSKISNTFGVSDNILTPTREDTTVYITIDRNVALSLLDILPKGSKLRRILKRLAK